MMTYIDYTPSQQPALTEFIELLQDTIIELDIHDRVIRHPDFGKYYTAKILKTLDNQQGKIILAFDEEKVVGMVVAIVQNRTPEEELQLKPAKYGEIEKLFVLEEYRGRGIGKELLEIAENYLQELQHCDYIEITVFGDNTKVHDLYKKLGYADREFVMIKKV